MSPRRHVLSTGPVQAAIRDAADALLSGGLVILPTETVYGVAACTRSADGLARLRRLKQRAPDKPFAVMVPDAEFAELYVPQPGRLARRLMRKAWPGPLTLVIESPDPDSSPAGRRFGRPAVEPLFNHDNTIGLRCPDNAVALEVLRAVDGPVVAASANPGGASPALTADEAAATLGGQVEVILDAGAAHYGIASTVVRIDPSGHGYAILRQGLLDRRMIDKLAVETWLFVCTGNTCRSPMAAAIAESQLAEKFGCPPEELPAHGIRIESAGVFAAEGQPATEWARRAVGQPADKRIAAHRARRLTVDAVQQADKIYVMTEDHRIAIIDMVPSAESKTRLLSPDGPIRDPIGGSLADYETAAGQIGRAVKNLIEDVE